jgi:hypothetical protein
MLADGGRKRTSGGLPLSDAAAEALGKAADWFVGGGSPWRSIRALARDHKCHHSTAADYVQRAKRRKASKERTR